MDLSLLPIEVLQHDVCKYLDLEDLYKLQLVDRRMQPMFFRRSTQHPLSTTSRYSKKLLDILYNYRSEDLIVALLEERQPEKIAYLWEKHSDVEALVEDYYQFLQCDRVSDFCDIYPILDYPQMLRWYLSKQDTTNYLGSVQRRSNSKDKYQWIVNICQGYFDLYGGIPYEAWCCFDPSLLPKKYQKIISRYPILERRWEYADECYLDY